jgi:hypothetical protein
MDFGPALHRFRKSNSSCPVRDASIGPGRCCAKGDALLEAFVRLLDDCKDPETRKCIGVGFATTGR